MKHTTLPPSDECYRALVTSDTGYDGVFVVGVKTTGIFCRPSCPARTPLRTNVTFFTHPDEAISAGFRACLRCRPLTPPGAPPDWISPLLAEVERDPTRRWRDQDLRVMGLDPVRVRRWFQSEHGSTFHGYTRARRLGAAMEQLQSGDSPLGVGFDHGWESASGFAEAFGQLFGAPPVRGRQTPLIRVQRLTSPLGPLLAGATDEAVVLLEFTDRKMLQTQLKRLRKHTGAAIVPGRHDLLERLVSQLAAYFAGELRDFDLPLHAPGTPFQEDVWAALGDIAYGQTASYGDVARAIGRPNAVRAVGRANGDNRLAILIPCHRVVGANGKLTGYGGGLWRKQALLDHERG